MKTTTKSNKKNANKTLTKKQLKTAVQKLTVNVDEKTARVNAALLDKEKAMQRDKQRSKEAAQRRKIDEAWQRKSQSYKYMRAAARSAEHRTVKRLYDEVLVNGYLELRKSSDGMSRQAKRRLVRRITEKRLAQAAARCGTAHSTVRHITEKHMHRCMMWLEYAL